VGKARVYPRVKKLSPAPPRVGSWPYLQTVDKAGRLAETNALAYYEHLKLLKYQRERKKMFNIFYTLRAALWQLL
jgi:hypothetical protein